MRKENKKEWEKLMGRVNSIYFVVLANYCITRILIGEIE